jgi:hypothetical protein
MLLAYAEMSCNSWHFCKKFAHILSTLIAYQTRNKDLYSLKLSYNTI